MHDEPTDFQSLERLRVEREMHEQALVHGTFRQSLLEAGFSTDESFQLVRDHHAVFTWAALVSDQEPPRWLGDPTSSEWSTSTDVASLQSKRSTREP